MIILRTIDSILNRYTMYRVVVYGLAALLGVSLVFALTGLLFISATGLCASIAILAAVTYAANRLLATLLRVPANTESWLITALILACILPPPTTLQRGLAIGLTGLLAMAGKYLLRWRGSNIFNPVAIAAVIVSVFGILPATWWIGSPPLAVPVIIVGLIVLRKARRFSLFASFALASLLMMLLIGSVLQGQSAELVLKTAVLSWPLIFLGTIMLTEPSTLPASLYYQLLYGLLVGCVFASQLHVGRISTTPQAALVIGNIFTVLVSPGLGMLVKLKRREQLTPRTYDLTFEVPRADRFMFLPGQYMEWTLPHAKVDSRGNRRTFTIASSPTEKELRIGIRRNEPSSSFKNALLALKPGQHIRAAHLGGDFVLPHDSRQSLVFIAGGVGITPFRSMLKYLTDIGQQRAITLLYIASNEQDFVYQEVLGQAAAIGLKTHYVVGRLEAAQLKNLLPTPEEQSFYISGPDALVRQYGGLVHGLGVSWRHIRTDDFSGY
jgi:ferredoxin-NADP reductase